MSQQDIIRVNIFRKNIVAVRDMKDPEVRTPLFGPTTENVDDACDS